MEFHLALQECAHVPPPCSLWQAPDSEPANAGATVEHIARGQLTSGDGPCAAAQWEGETRT